MAIPLTYNVRSARARWTSSVVAVLSIGGAVGVFVATLAMANGFRAAVAESGSPENALVLRAGATSEMESAVLLEQVRIIEAAPAIARGRDNKPLVSSEVVVIASLPRRDTDTDANVQVRGVSASALEVHAGVRLAAGAFFQPGLPELVVGSNAARLYRGFELGATPQFGGQTWRVVGILDAGGTAFDSEIWCDAAVLNQTYKRPVEVFQAVSARLVSAEALATFKDALTTDPRLTVEVQSEADYYAAQSTVVTNLIRTLGVLVAIVMGSGAVFAALNTMYSAVAARTRELATMRALGFSGASVVLSMLFESLVIALAGGLVGCLAALPFNGFTASTINWQTFSHLAFAFRVTPGLLAEGLLFAALMGVAGGLAPALRAARLPVAAALREL